MKTEELREKDLPALREELTELRRERFKLRMQVGSGRLGRPSELRRVRRCIARVLTVLAERKEVSDK